MLLSLGAMFQSNKIKLLRRWLQTAAAMQACWLISGPTSAAPPVQRASTNQIILARARALFTAGHVLEARRIVEPLCNRPDSSAAMYCLLAETYIDDYAQNSKDSTKIETILRTAIKIDPTYSLTYKDLA
jgi:hypothetical protein